MWDCIKGLPKLLYTLCVINSHYYAVYRYYKYLSSVYLIFFILYSSVRVDTVASFGIIMETATSKDVCNVTFVNT